MRCPPCEGAHAVIAAASADQSLDYLLFPAHSNRMNATGGYDGGLSNNTANRVWVHEYNGEEWALERTPAVTGHGGCADTFLLVLCCPKVPQCATSAMPFPADTLNDLSADLGRPPVVRAVLVRCLLRSRTAGGLPACNHQRADPVCRPQDVAQHWCNGTGRSVRCFFGQPRVDGWGIAPNITSFDDAIVNGAYDPRCHSATVYAQLCSIRPASRTLVSSSSQGAAWPSW